MTVPNITNKPELQFVDRQINANIPSTAIVGTTGLRRASGYIFEEGLSQLRYWQGQNYYRAMWDDSAVIGAVMFIVQAVLRACPWSVKSANDTSAATAEQEFLESNMGDAENSWGDFISEVITMLIFGFSIFEVVMKLRKGEHLDDPMINSQYSDGRFGIRSLEMRAQETIWQWAMSRRGDYFGAIQLDIYNQTGNGPVFLPADKILHFKTRSFKGNPEGYSVLRPAVRAFHYVKRLEEIEAISMDRSLAGMPVMEVPPQIMLPDASNGEKQLFQTLQTMVQQVKMDERWGAVIPSSTDGEGKSTGYKFSIMSGGAGGSRQSINDAIVRYNTSILTCFSSDFIQLGQSKVGTQSLFEGKSNLFMLGLTHYLDIIAETLNRTLVPRIMRLNAVPRNLWPTFEHGKLDKPDLDVLGTFLQKVGAAGILSPNRQLEERVLEIADLPAPSEDDTAVFDDLTTPTPSKGADRAVNLLSSDQAADILKINEAVASKKLGPKAAAKLLAQRLGMDDAHAAEFLETPEKEEAPIVPGVVPPKPGVPVSPQDKQP
jgi:hypothetical protein